MSLSDRINAGLRRVPTWPLYAMGALPPFWYFYLGLTGGLGAEPISALEHRLGLLGLQFLLLGLAVTPLRRFAGINLIRFRRMIGLLAFYYICMHLLTWLVLDIRDPARIWADIVKRPYITVGMVGFLALVPLAATSNNASVRKLGKRWRQLHWLVYPAVVLGAVHFVMLRKGWQIEPLVYLAAFVILIVLRLIPRPPVVRRSARA
ncbi:protein-methionine-sulfoxide reductase heme-binding subunit MsrQ [Sinisalibacter lacisalsi]|uniref:Protein-methionine-sulfoxide reductase heme-binding subunit MsrQ n=1 Tax=Sinisalibacter lacisalsi TaxID=1526570 RepID=A0ABQ1QA22_9RHOB|nr:protein-methionine-sulfoxide reductase heme-binding subunit MsrQ [Sinisalibacter lacisalsi]GGD19580.1 protein-methionine-sulfoxide reductase heme-binding subunit MsrQ [Sinisalibacter lacisalsi]